MKSTEIDEEGLEGTPESSGKRRYRKRRRARQEAETRLRITEAVMELHRTVGPARTTVKEVAERAGVGRQTVYNHFPTEGDLIEACSTHWAGQNPLPDPAVWAQCDDPDERLAGALVELFGWYAGTEDMMGKVLRDAPLVESLGELMEERWFALVAAMVDVLSAGWRAAGDAGVEAAGEGAEGERRVRAAVRLAVDFWTWRTLRDSGLGTREAAEVAAGAVRAAVADRRAAAGRVEAAPEPSAVG